MLQWEAVQTCTTIGEYITGVVLKELFAVQLHRHADEQIKFDPAPVQELVEKLVPDVARDILETASGWIPAVAEVSPSSLLPDLDQYPAALLEVEGLSVQHRKLLLEALEIILDVFNDPSTDAGSLETPMLPRPSLASIAAQVATLLEHLTWLRPQNAAAQLNETDVDLASWERVCAAGRGHPAPHSKAELIDELQQCRQRIFHLEKEMTKQARTAEANTDRAKREHDRSSSRLLEVNHALEGKLRQQIQETRACKEQLSDYEHRIEHEQWRVEQQGNRIQQLEAELDKLKRMQDDMLVREKEYGRRILHLHLHEFESACRNDQRMRKLASAISGNSSTEVHWESDATDLAELAQTTLNKLQKDFDEIFEERQQRFREVIRQCETSLQQRQSRFDAIREQTWRDTFGAHERHGRGKHGKAMPGAKRRITVDTGVQTELDQAEGAAEPFVMHSMTQPQSARVRRRSVQAQGRRSDTAAYAGGHGPAPGSRPISRLGAALCSRQASGPAGGAAKRPESSAEVEPLRDAPWLMRRDQVGKRSSTDKRYSL